MRACCRGAVRGTARENARAIARARGESGRARDVELRAGERGGLGVDSVGVDGVRDETELRFASSVAREAPPPKNLGVKDRLFLEHARRDEGERPAQETTVPEDIATSPEGVWTGCSNRCRAAAFLNRGSTFAPKTSR